MRKDIFVVGARLLGVWQLLGAISTLAYLVFYWIGYYPLQVGNREYSLIHFGTELLLGLVLTLRPYSLFRLIERFAESGMDSLEENVEVKESVK